MNDKEVYTNKYNNKYMLYVDDHVIYITSVSNNIITMKAFDNITDNRNIKANITMHKSRRANQQLKASKHD